ncbi:MAG: hypothetical protein A2020_16380 [Lentisphaerae bacterium GWF2_45_14]|nr:MAG: hypothetical protein A2020_16380 [Lentisphaerae bacterium GWF2_45_14]
MTTDFKDLDNDYKEFSVNDGERIAEQINSAPPVSEEADSRIDEILNHVDARRISFETLAALGGGVKIGRITIPPPSMGVLSLLDMIESPFVTGDASKISINEVLKSLYVMSRGRDAVQPLMESIALGKSIEKSKEIAEKSPQFFDVYLKYHAINAAKRSAFDAAVDAFADEIGLFDPEAAISLIGDYLTACMAGFDMLEKKPESDLVKKKSGFWTLTGSLLSRLISMMLFRAIMKK